MSRLIASLSALKTFFYAQVISVINNVVNAFLTWWYPILSTDGRKSIPTCPWEWPNGQGDVAKFLEGQENSDRWGKSHGAIFRIWSGTTPEIVLTDPRDVRAVFYDSDKHTKALNNDSGWLMGELLGKCVGLISGSDWRKVRNETATSFSHTNCTVAIPRIEEIVKGYFEEPLLQSRLNKGKLNPVQDLRMLPFWVVADMLYGEISSELKTELQEIIIVRDRIWACIMQGGITRYSWNKYLPLQVNRDLQLFKRRWANFNLKAWEASLRTEQDTSIVEMYRAVEQKKISITHLLHTLDEMLFANLDVTMGGLSWNLLFLAEHPDVQAQLREEHFATLEGPGSKAREQYLRSSSTLLAASIMESARLRPLAAFSVPQSAPTTRNIQGFIVPRGTNFIVDAYKLNIQNPYWGSDAETYRPARFLESKASEMRYHYWRFGFGPRQCIGKYIADIIIKVVLVNLVENWQLSADEQTHWERDGATWILHPNTEIMCERIGTVDGVGNN